MRHSKKLAALAIAAGVAITASAALAYWSSTGSGTGSAATAVGANDNISLEGDVVGEMFPGDAPQALDVTVTNNDPDATRRVADVVAWITTDKTDCDGDDFLINDEEAPSLEANAVSLNWDAMELAAGASHVSENDIQFNNKADTNQDACKDAAVTIHYAAS